MWVDEFVVFNLKGNDYRLVTAVRCDKQIMYIRFAGTHSVFDRIDGLTRVWLLPIRCDVGVNAL